MRQIGHASPKSNGLRLHRAKQSLTFTCGRRVTPATVRPDCHPCEEIMRSRILCTAALAALIAGASPAWAQQTNPAGTQANQVGAKKPTAAERERARVTVQKRSFLDAGVEVK